jgi:hypothetical protein
MAILALSLSGVYPFDGWRDQVGFTLKSEG